MPALTVTRGLDVSRSLQGAGGIGGLLAMTESSGTSSFYHNDGGGNVTALINVNQLLVGKYLYDPFGYPLSYTGPKAPVNPYWFSSELCDADTGFLHYPRRVYVPIWQRWLNQDPIGIRGGINLFAYVGNNPVNAVDPLGLWNLWNPATWGDANPNGWSLGNSLTPWNDSSGYTWEGIKWNTGQAAQATLDGIIPFWDPFGDNGGYDKCDKTLAFSRHAGAFSRDIYLGARIPNLTQWLKNPVLYEAGSVTVPTRVFEMVEGLSPAWRGRWLGAFGETFAPYGAGEMVAAYAQTWNTGFTPLGRAVTLGLGSLTSSKIGRMNSRTGSSGITNLTGTSGASSLAQVCSSALGSEDDPPKRERALNKTTYRCWFPSAAQTAGQSAAKHRQVLCGD